MLLNAGYFPTTYFAASYWNNRYFPKYGTYVPPVLPWKDGMYLMSDMGGGVVYLKQL
jgi:hypothetical protein